MKLHVEDANGPDVVKAELTRFALVYLDGVKQDRVVMADEENGVIERYIPNDDPRFKVEMMKQGGDCWPTETVYGRVVIKDDRDTYKPAPLTGFGCDISKRIGDED